MQRELAILEEAGLTRVRDDGRRRHNMNLGKKLGLGHTCCILELNLLEFPPTEANPGHTMDFLGYLNDVSIETTSVNTL